tara:strand:+ start:150 stop:992 length:843 start_codon:yes stop_codon:yes gene_type:complete
MSPALAYPLGGLIPLAGLSLSIPFLGNQQQGKENIYEGINFGNQANTSSGFSLPENYFKLPSKSDFQGLLNIMSGDPKLLDFLKPNSLKSTNLVENKPTTMLQEQNQILGADGEPITSASSSSSSTTFDNTDISSNNNNNNNNKDGNNVNKLLFGSLLINPLFEGGRYLFDKAKDIFSKDDDDDKGKSDFEDITGITYEKAMELQRKRENELMNRRALEGGIKDAGKYMYLAGAAGAEAGKNIGRNTQDMLRSMAYGQAALANTIAGASKTTPLARTYFS